MSKQARGEGARLAEALVTLWPHVAGRTLSRHSRPLTLFGGTLTVAVAPSDWKPQVEAVREVLRGEVNRSFGCEIVKKLRLRAAETLPPAPESPLSLPPVRPLEAGEGAEMQPALDPEIAAVLCRSFAKYFAKDRRRAC